MNNDDNASMPTLTIEQKNTLVHAIMDDSGGDLDYYGFLEILLGRFEGVPGFEIAKPKVSLLNEMWRIYEGLKKH